MGGLVPPKMNGNGLEYQGCPAEDKEGDSLKPYLSVVVFSRNDDHSAFMLRRMHLCLNSFIQQLEGIRLPSEVIVVEWNPPQDRPLIKDVYKWPDNLNFCSLRIITVPFSVHRHFVRSDIFHMHTKIAPNVGIRRAKGEFILVTSIDCMLSREVFSFFAEKKLSKGSIYRMDRSDVKRDVLKVDDLGEQLDYCRDNIIDVHSLNPLKFIFKRLPILHNKAAGDFVLLSRERWDLLRGFPEIDPLGTGSDDILIYMAYFSGVKQKILGKRGMRLYHIDHDSFWKGKYYVLLRRWLRRLKTPFWLIDLLAKILSLFFPKKSKVAELGFKPFAEKETYAMIREMARKERSYIYNGQDWGAGQFALEEFSISAKFSDRTPLK